MDPLEYLCTSVREELGVVMEVLEDSTGVVLMEIERGDGAPGSGRLALERLCAYADEAGKPTYLALMEHTAKLIALYESLGFRADDTTGEDEGGLNMVRPPHAHVPEAAPSALGR